MGANNGTIQMINRIIRLIKQLSKKELFELCSHIERNYAVRDTAIFTVDGKVDIYKIKEH